MLSINIEDNAIKLTVYQGKRVKLAINEPLNSGLVQDGVVIDKAAIGGIIKGILSANGIIEKDACACVSGVHSIYRVVYIPNIEKSLLAEAARREMERASPVPLETLYSSWQDVKVSSVETALCLLGIPRDNIDSVCSAVEEAGLKLKFLELKPLSVARVASEGTAIIIDVGNNGFDIVVKDRGIPELIRNLSFSSSSMSDLEKVAQIKDEADKTISFYNSSHRERPMSGDTPCYLGGVLRDNLAQSLGYVIKPIPVLITYPAGTDEDQFTANTGLAMRTEKAASRYMRVENNVLPGTTAARAAPASNLVPVVTFAICAVIAASTFFITQAVSRETTNLQAKITERTKQVTDVQKQLKEEVDKLKQDLENNKQAAAAMKEPLAVLAQQRLAVNTELGEVISALPATMYLASVNSDGIVMNLEGMSPNESMVMDYARDLRYSGLFSMVLTTYVENRDYTEILFKIVLTLKR